MNTTQHIPVLFKEVVEFLAPKGGDFLIDGTFGGGGHTDLLSRAVGETGTVLAMDRDLAAIDASEARLRERFARENRAWNIRIAHANYCDFPEALQMLDVPQVDGILLDIGLSSDQLADRERGFSFDSDGPLDLRFDISEGMPAYGMLQKMTEERIANVIYEYGEERFSRRIAREIVLRQRENRPIQTAGELAELVRKCVPPVYRKSAYSKRSIPIDPATRTFQALRIAVNDELGSLSTFLSRAASYVKPGGRIAIISFHSLEDRIVKNAFRDDPLLEVVTKKPILAAEEELESNPRSRSAKLRVAARI